MTLVMFCPKTGGQQTRQFRSLRRARSFVQEAARRDFSHFAYLMHAKNGRVNILAQFRHGQDEPTYYASRGATPEKFAFPKHS